MEFGGYDGVDCGFEFGLEGADVEGLTEEVEVGCC